MNASVNKILVKTWVRSTLRTLKERYETVRDNEEATPENQESAIAALGALDISISRLGEAAQHLELDALIQLEKYKKFREAVEELLEPEGREMNNFEHKVFEHNLHTALNDLKRRLQEEG